MLLTELLTFSYSVSDTVDRQDIDGIRLSGWPRDWCAFCCCSMAVPSLTADNAPVDPPGFYVHSMFHGTMCVFDVVCEMRGLDHHRGMGQEEPHTQKRQNRKANRKRTNKKESTFALHTHTHTQSTSNACYLVLGCVSACALKRVDILCVLGVIDKYRRLCQEQCLFF